MSPTISRVASILGVIGIGSAYVPIDPNLPDGRIRAMMDSAGAGHVIVDGRTAAVFSSMPYELVDASECPVSDSADSALAEPGHADLAYIIYTSGSTGAPKGVAVEHGSLSHLLRALDGVLPARRDDSAQCWLAAANICFDMSVADLFWPLSRGIPVVVAELESLAGRSDEGAEFLTAVLASGRITHFQATPSLVQLMLRDPVLAGAIRGLQVLVMGGEIVQPDLVAQLRPVPYVFNGYGPTEATVYTTMHRCTGADVDQVPIGRPLPGVDVRVVDEAGRDCPNGVLGELLIAGPGLARGYINDAELTARKFPVLDARRWYRTGDLATIDADSTVRYHGRVDSQVKVRGFRVELGEIEAAIRAIPGVDEAVVFPVRGPGGRVTGLTAAAKSTAAGLTEAAIFAGIGEVLPRYAIPQAVRILPELPIGLTGKIDRKALERQLVDVDPEPRQEPAAGRRFDGRERIVAGMWSSALGVDMSGETDRTFFDAGGNSVLLGSVFARLRAEFPEADLHLVDMYRYPTISAMAARLGAGGAPPESSDSGSRPGPGENRRTPLSAAERRRLARRAK
jgi:amino acid adenylation domain-containing protein